jgi:hypothetical protein
MQPEILTQLAARLYALRHTGRIIPIVEVGIGDGSKRDDWKPSAHYCHANVDIWVARCPEYEPIRGWVVFDLSQMPSSMKVRPHFQFSAHSVARAPNGKLLDITPQTTMDLYPFIRHPDGDEDFDNLRRDYDVMKIQQDHPARHPHPAAFSARRVRPRTEKPLA